MLLPSSSTPSPQSLKSLKNTDSLVPSDASILAFALGAPARRVLTRAEALGPKTGWRDGYLTRTHGFCPPDPEASPIALAGCPGRLWSDLCGRMPGLVGRGKIREAILELPLVDVCLGILASVWRYEERNDGYEGVAATTVHRRTRSVEEEEEVEEELKGIPKNIAGPFRTVCRRMGRVLPHLTQYDVSIYNYKIRDHASVYPYVNRSENMDLRWPVFQDRAEAMFLLCMAEVHGTFMNGVEIVTRCQEMVVERDNEGLLGELIKLKEIIDQLGHVFHKISVNPRSGEQFANPVEWGQRYAKFSAPLSNRVPALSGLALPLFQLMDAFLGRTKYDTFLGLEALHLRAWLPLNHRAFIAAIEQYYQVPAYVASTGDRRLIGVLGGIVESYAGERGFMGTHRWSGDNSGRPWEEVHRTLSDSMIERLDPFRGSISLKPHEMRGCFEECRFMSRIIGRDFIDADKDRSTGKVTVDLRNTGVTFGPGDRLAIMPLNSWREVVKVAKVLGVVDRFDEKIPIDKADDWKRFSKHMADVSRNPKAGEFTLKDVLRRGHLAPLTKETVMAVHFMLRASSTGLLEVLASESWPVSGSLGDLLGLAQSGVSSSIWDSVFGQDLSWIPKLVPVEVPRTYSISSFSDQLLPSFVNLTVSRVEHKLCPLLTFDGSNDILRSGISSGFLNPHPSEDEDASDIPASIKRDDGDDTVLIGISRPLNFQLPISPTAPVAMFAGGSGIAPFRSFWQERFSTGAVGRNILFLGVQSRKKFVYESELLDHVRHHGLELHTAFSRDTKGLSYDASTQDLIEKETEPRYLDAIVAEKRNLICDLIMSTKQGGLGGYLYICGSVSVYETIIRAVTKAIYQARAVTQKSADALVATAFAERRFMLDIFMTPRAMSFNEPIIPFSTLSRNTGHREGDKTWIGVHGAVYDVTDFLPIHPGGSLIVAASAGLDASKTFDEIAHTSNPEVMSLLSKYFIGYLAPKPDLKSAELIELYDAWMDYLRSCVESLTTLSFEVKDILKDANVWFSGGMLNMGGVRKLYQFQSRLMQDGFTTLFGPKLQELFVKLSFTLVSAQHNFNSRLPDIMGIVARAQSSPAATAAQKEIAQVGEYVCDSSTAQAFERSIIQYAQAVTELDVRFLEQVREDICTGINGFDVIVAFLVSLLERIAERLDTYYVELSALSLYHPEIEPNPARTRWRIVRRRIRDGSFFVYTQDITIDSSGLSAMAMGGRSRLSVTFDQVISQANAMVQQSLSQQQDQRGHDNISELQQQRPQKRLADTHARRAKDSSGLLGVSSYEKHLDRRAAYRVSTFLEENMKAIRRLSRAVNGTAALDHALGSSRATPSPLRPDTRKGDGSNLAALVRQGIGSEERRMKALERTASVSSSSSESSSSSGRRKVFCQGHRGTR
ncbi:hypothetical protein BDD12DRAFT_935731 [Trichophaea hybrida]|nr:hypothetical protein BDD12DRAFT_935731 [Trichophaea hybrida]